MKTLRSLLFLMTLALATTGAFAWPTCNGNWVSVPKTTTGGTLYSTGDLLFQCQVPTPPPTPDPKPTQVTNTNNNTNQNSNSNSNNNSSKSDSSSSSGAIAGATSGSSSSAKGGNATANGGTVKDSGNSSSTSGVKNSGNSTAVAAGGQGGKGGSAQQGQDQGQSQSSTSSADGNGNGANNSSYSSTSNTLVQRNTPMAYAPEAIPSAPCVKGFSGGASGPAFGASFGGGKTDKECEIRETARAFALGGSRLAYCKVLITTKDAKAAGVSLDDCMLVPVAVPVPVAQVIPVPVPVVTAPIVTEQEIEVPAAPVPAERNLTVVKSGQLNNVAKQQLDDAVLFFKSAQGGSLILQADSLTGVYREQRIMSYLSEAGVNTSNIRVRLTKDFGKDVAVLYSVE